MVEHKHQFDVIRGYLCVSLVAMFQGTLLQLRLVEFRSDLLVVLLSCGAVDCGTKIEISRHNAWLYVP